MAETDRNSRLANEKPREEELKGWKTDMQGKKHVNSKASEMKKLKGGRKSGGSRKLAPKLSENYMKRE